MQPPTCSGIHVRSTRDAEVLFHAVSLNILPMVVRRLDTKERMALRSGCVYIWEQSESESDPHGIKRFTEGRSWAASRLRDNFLLYLERDSDTRNSPRNTRERANIAPDMRMRTSIHHSPYSAPVTARFRGMIKKTYSVYVDSPQGRRKWHLNAYYTEDTLDQLATVDDMPALRSLRVPLDTYKCARNVRISGGSLVQVPISEDEPGPSGQDVDVDADDSEDARSHISRSSSASPQIMHTQNRSSSHTHPRLSISLPSFPIPAYPMSYVHSRTSSNPSLPSSPPPSTPLSPPFTSPARLSASSPPHAPARTFQLVPIAELDRLELHAQRRPPSHRPREPMEEEALRLFAVPSFPPSRSSTRR